MATESTARQKRAKRIKSAFFQSFRNIMTKWTTPGRLFVAIAMVAFGVQHLIYLNFVTRVVPPLPQWIPAHSLLAGVFGAFLIVAGVVIIVRIEAQTIALLLGGII